MTDGQCSNHRGPRGLVRASLVATLTLLAALIVCATAAARTDLTQTYKLKRCHGTIRAGFTPEERRHRMHYGRYNKISCRRARLIVRKIDRTEGAYPQGYGWQTPHGPSSTWPTVFHRILRSAYLSPDGYQGSRSTPGVAVVTFR